MEVCLPFIEPVDHRVVRHRIEGQFKDRFSAHFTKRGGGTPDRGKSPNMSPRYGRGLPWTRNAPEPSSSATWTNLRSWPLLYLSGKDRLRVAPWSAAGFGRIQKQRQVQSRQSRR